MRSLFLGLMMLLAQTAHAGFLLDGQGGFLLDDKGGKILIADGVHTLTFMSEWGTGQHVHVWFDVKADRSGIVIWGAGFDDKQGPVTETEIVQVLANGQFVSLAKCQANACTADWKTSSMAPGNNEVMFFMTSSAGRYGATTRLTRP